MLLLGNDYLPKLKKSSTDLWNQYLELRNNSSSDNEFLINEGYTLNYQFLMKFLALIDDRIPKYQSELDSNTCKFKVKKKYMENVKCYLQGLLWNLYMYTTGSCADYSYVYNTYRAPTARDIFFYIHSIAKYGEIQLSLNPSALPLFPLAFCITLIPIEAKECIPEVLHHLIEETSPIYDILSPKKSYSEYPIIDTERIKNAVLQIPKENFTNISQKKLVNQFAPSIILMNQKNHTLPRKSYSYKTPKPPVSRFNRLRYPSGIQALHFDINKRKYNQPKWPL